MKIPKKYLKKIKKAARKSENFVKPDKSVVKAAKRTRVIKDSGYSSSKTMKFVYEKGDIVKMSKRLGFYSGTTAIIIEKRDDGCYDLMMCDGQIRTYQGRYLKLI